MKTLLIVESPSKANTIQKYLGKDFIVKASVGHIVDLAKTPSNNLGIEIDNKFKAKYALMPDKVQVLKDLLEAGKKCDQIILASDPDREGEAIAWHLRERLKDLDKPIKRAVFHKITASEVKSALKNLRDVDEKLFAAQEARRILDRIVGFTASPFLMNVFKESLSAGRVQSVLTELIVDREEEINSFVPETFFTITANFNKGITFSAKFDHRVTDETIAENVKKECIKNNDFTVINVVSQEEEKFPPPPLMTLTLQKLMANKYGFDPERTMKSAQSLYEDGRVSYIRTDSVRVSNETLENLFIYMDDNNIKRPSKPYEYKNKDSAQDAHECIHPTDMDYSPSSIANPDDQLVYEAIFNHYLASQMPPAIYDTLKVTLASSKNKKLIFKASGKALKEPSYLNLLKEVDSSKIEIPHLTKGEAVQFAQIPITVEKKKTQPPPRYSQGKILDELYKRGIGRPATYADLISRVSARNYVDKRNNIFYPTELGKKVTSMLSSYFSFMKYDYTADMEKKLDDIAEAKLDKVQMLDDFYKNYKNELDKAYSNNLDCLTCDKCDQIMTLRKSKAGNEYYACTSYPKCKNTKSK